MVSGAVTPPGARTELGAVWLNSATGERGASPCEDTSESDDSSMALLASASALEFSSRGIHMNLISCPLAIVCTSAAS